MALSGSLTTTGGYEGRNLKFTWEATQSVEGNTSTIKWTLAGTGGEDNYWYKSAPFTVVINGATVYSSSTRIQLRKTTTVATGETIVSHNAVGDATLAVSVSAAIFYSTVNSTGSQTWTLDNIPRATVPTLSVNPINIGEDVIIYTPAASTTFRHKLYYNWYSTTNGSPTWVYIGMTRDLVRWALPLDFANNLPATPKGTGTIRCETYNGDTLIGTKDISFTGAVPETSDFKPTIDVLVDEPTGYMGKYGALVKGYSRINVKTQGTAKYKADISEIQVTVDGTTHKGEDVTTGAILATDTDTVEIRVVAVDSRGLKSDPFTTTFTALDYTAPTIEALAVHRCNEDGSENEKGEHVSVTFSATVTPLRNYNSATYTLRYTKGTDGSTYYLDLPALVGQYVVTCYTIPAVEMDGSSTWSIEVEAKDDITRTSRATSVSTAFTLMNWGPDGTSMGIGKVAEKENTLEVALDMEVSGAVKFTGPVTGAVPDMVDYIVGTGTEAMGSNGTWYWTKWASGRAECYGTRNYGNMAISEAWVSLFVSPAFTQTLPTGLFISAPTASIESHAYNGTTWIAKSWKADTLESTDKIGPFFVVSAVSGTYQKVYIDFHALGRWK